ncbi:MAG: DUF447 family protein [Methanoregula sp.]|nr:DUF447 family protein [Methanoregula sp.]
MGLIKGGINEVIATTVFNAAPIGIHHREGKTSIVLFLGSHTAENVERDGWVVANFVHDPLLYVRTAFEDLPRNSFIEEPVAGKTMYRLAEADAWAAFTAIIERRTSEAMIIRLSLVKEIIEEVAEHPVNRGFNSIIDATVHATRYQITRDPRLIDLIKYHEGIVRKCGGKRELEALDLLTRYIR